MSGMMELVPAWRGPMLLGCHIRCGAQFLCGLIAAGLLIGPIPARAGEGGAAAAAVARSPLSAQAELRVFVDPETGEFIDAPAGSATTPREGKPKATAPVLVERPHPDPRIRGVISLPEDFQMNVTEERVGDGLAVGCE